MEEWENQKINESERDKNKEEACIHFNEYSFECIRDKKKTGKNTCNFSWQRGLKGFKVRAVNEALKVQKMTKFKEKECEEIISNGLYI